MLHPKIDVQITLLTFLRVVMVPSVAIASLVASMSLLGLPFTEPYVALAIIKSEHARPGTTLQMETTVEYERKKVRVSTVKPPFFDPPRERMLL